MSQVVTAISALLLLTSSGIASEDISDNDEVWVSPSGSDLNNGTEQSPVSTIQRALNLTADEGTILLAAGSYVGPGNVDLTITARTLTLANGPNASVGDVVIGTIAGTQSQSGLVFDGGNYTISGILWSNLKSAIVTNGNTQLTIDNCIFSSSIQGSQAGLGSALAMNSGSLFADKTQFVFNQGPAISLNNCGGNFHNCSFLRNTADAIMPGVMTPMTESSVLAASGGHVLFKDSQFQDNGSPALSCSGFASVISFSDSCEIDGAQAKCDRCSVIQGGRSICHVAPTPPPPTNGSSMSSGEVVAIVISVGLLLVIMGFAATNFVRRRQRLVYGRLSGGAPPPRGTENANFSSFVSTGSAYNSL